MFTSIILSTVVILFAVSVILRVLFRSILNPYRLRRPYFGPYGYYGYSRGYRRGIFPGGGLLTILVIVTLERLFGRRW